MFMFMQMLRHVGFVYLPLCGSEIEETQKCALVC